MSKSKVLRGALFAKLYPCPHGFDYCCYHEHDDEICKACLEDSITVLKKELKRVRLGLGYERIKRKKYEIK